MKFLSLLIIFLGIFTISNAQLTKSTWLVGGSGSFNSSNENFNSPSYSQTAKTTSINVNGSFGFFLADKFVVGIQPYLSTTKGVVTYSSSGSGGSTNSFQLAAGPFARYYFLNAEKNYNLLTDISYQIGINKSNGAQVAKGKFNTFSLMSGADFFLIKQQG